MAVSQEEPTGAVTQSPWLTSLKETQQTSVGMVQAWGAEGSSWGHGMSPMGGGGCPAVPPVPLLADAPATPPFPDDPEKPPDPPPGEASGSPPEPEVPALPEPPVEASTVEPPDDSKSLSTSSLLPHAPERNRIEPAMTTIQSF